MLATTFYSQVRSGWFTLRLRCPANLHLFLTSIWLQTLGFLVHAILGIRPSAKKRRRGIDSQDRMDQSIIIEDSPEGNVNIDHDEVVRPDPTWQ